MKPYKKIDWNLTLTVISVVAATISSIAALAANRQSMHSLELASEANQLSQEANRIAQESQLPKIDLDYLFSFEDFSDYYKAPCWNIAGYSEWQVEFAPIFDITNTGGKSVSLVDYHEGDLGGIVNFHPNIEVHSQYDFFLTQEEFEKWFNARSAPSGAYILLRQSQGKIEIAGIPTNIGPGETKRIVLRGRVEIRFGNNLSPKEILNLLWEVHWKHKMVFVFGDDTRKEVEIELPNPYAWYPGRNADLQPYEPCPTK